MCSIRDFFPIEYRVSGAKPKKNFIQENKRYVTKLAKDTQSTKENVKPSNKLLCTNTQNFKLRRQEPIKEAIPENTKIKIKSIDLDQIDASIKSIRSAIAQTKITQQKLGIKNVEKLSLTFRDQATQTVNPYEEKGKLKDNIIRCPMSENSDMTKTIQMKQMSTTSVQTENSESEYSNFMSKKNVESVHQQDDNKFKRKQNIVGLKEKIIDHHRPGEIPKYLKDRKALKEKNEKEIQKKLAIRHELGIDDPACPPGHVLLPEPERLEHLAKIKTDYARLVLQLNMLPVSSDSYKMKEKRKRIEKELDQVQLGIKLFSKEKLYVKINQKMAASYK